MKRLFTILLLVFSLTSYSQQCVFNWNATVVPASSPTLPIGQWTPGQVITITYTIPTFNGININWIHAIEIILGPGFINLTPITAPGNPAGSTGSWLWDVQHTYPGGFNFGPGWRFVNTGNAGWGTSSTGPFVMSFQVTVDSTCTPDPLNISMQVIDDCTTGGWSNGNCCTDPPHVALSGTVYVQPITTSNINHY